MVNRWFPRRLLLSILLLISVASGSFAQSDSCHLQISLLTCSPGEELYSSWGHTAIRVVDKTTNTDIVFNYGTFDDSDPLFLARFTKGLMIYSLSAYPYSDFLEEYRYYQRGVIEQPLELDCAVKSKIFEALKSNYSGTNRFYNYYFSSDNCTTRARDILAANIGSMLKLGKVIPEDAPTFRNLIHIYLDSTHQYWNKFGIDILLGATLDKKVSNEEAMFLPDYLMKAFDSARVNNQPLVLHSAVVLKPTSTISTGFYIKPNWVFWILYGLILMLGFSRKKSAVNFLLVFDRILFTLLGLLGAVLLTLWIIRIDTVCRNNYNLFWALPTHLVIAFIPWNKKWVKYYFKTIMIISIILALLFFLLPQQMNHATLPIILLIILRARNRSK